MSLLLFKRWPFTFFFLPGHQELTCQFVCFLVSHWENNVEEVWAFRCASRVALHVVSNYSKFYQWISYWLLTFCSVFVAIFSTVEFIEINLKINKPFLEVVEHLYHQLPPLQCLHLGSVGWGHYIFQESSLVAHYVSGQNSLCNEQDLYHNHPYHFCHYLLLKIYWSFFHFSRKAREKDVWQAKYKPFSNSTYSFPCQMQCSTLRKIYHIFLILNPVILWMA